MLLDVPRSIGRRVGVPLALLCAMWALTACGSSAPPPSNTKASAPTPKITFIEDDYEAALRSARQRGKPLFVDAWATWCHSCLSLRAYVFDDPALTRLADRFVWVSLDTEKPSSKQFLAKFPMEAWPTLWVIEPETESPILKWEGTATGAELASLLEDAELAYRHGGDSEATAQALAGHKAAASGDHVAAIAAYRKALAGSAADWARRPPVVEALSGQLLATKDYAGCIDLALGELPNLPPGTPRAMVAVTGLECVRALPKWSSKRNDGAALVAVIRRMALDPNQPLLADDRSSLFEALVDQATANNDVDETKRLAHAWATFLEGEVAKAKSASERAVFDGHRMSAYLALGEPERAISMLKDSEREMPNDANPPARLAKVYFAIKRWDDAAAAIRRAIAKGYGPRKLRHYALAVDIELARGDKAAAKKLLQEALAYADTVTLSGSYLALRDELKARLARM
jgi:tetratricopeptide (TPR) repeat protein